MLSTRSDLEFCIIRPGGLKSEEPSGIVNVIDGEALTLTLTLTR